MLFGLLLVLNCAAAVPSARDSRSPAEGGGYGETRRRNGDGATIGAIDLFRPARVDPYRFRDS